MGRDKNILVMINQLEKKQRRLVVIVAAVAFIVGVILGSVWTYRSIERVTIITASEGIRV